MTTIAAQLRNFAGSGGGPGIATVSFVRRHLACVPFAIAAVTAACAEPPPGLPQAFDHYCETNSWSHTHKGFAQVDLLFVIDRSAAMAARGDQLRDNLRAFGQWLEDDRSDLHVAVVAADGDEFLREAQSPDCAATDARFLRREREPWFTCGDNPGARCPAVNYSGSLADALPCRAAVEARDGALRQPLEAAVLALEDPAVSDFRRPRAEALYVVVIAAGDDQSPGAVDEYAARLAAAAGSVDQLLVRVVAPGDATRLHAVAAQTTLPLDPIDVAQPSWLEAMTVIDALHRDVLPGSCMRYVDYDGVVRGIVDTDVDPDNPGIQPPCFATPIDEFNRAGLAVDSLIPPCTMATPTRPSPDSPHPCWWFDTRSWASCELDPVTEGISWVEWQCEALCR